MKKNLLTPESASRTPLTETSQQTIERLTADNAKLQAQVDKHESAEAQRAAEEKIIVEKMAHGLSRQQAINVIRRQREFDEAAKPKSKAHDSKSKAK